MPNCPHTNDGVLGRERHVLRRQRVDRGRHDVDVPVHARGHVLAHVEQRLGVVRYVGQQLGDRLRVGRRQVDVTTPHPALRLLRHQPVQRGRLRVVDQAHVPAARQLTRVHLVVLPPGLPLLLVEILRGALERVVHELGRVEELLAPVDHLPLALQPDVAHQRHERVQDLRYPAAERGGGDVHDPAALSAARPARGSRRSAPARRCACSRRASCVLLPRAGARGWTIPNRRARIFLPAAARISRLRLRRGEDRTMV